ncbi:hypothetical protein NDU88_008091 [Pleurodeles waltl]|uniref:Uncharacterized protein n=1 Tax=Pleurodeles waltl TaxID=8319 RepID=A0AAV7VUH0_PLEWA|nr:hypothetical protein NDU88_008091 [Pleurodeles waltl]
MQRLEEEDLAALEEADDVFCEGNCPPVYGLLDCWFLRFARPSNRYFYETHFRLLYECCASKELLPSEAVLALFSA